MDTQEQLIKKRDEAYRQKEKLAARVADLMDELDSARKEMEAKQSEWYELSAALLHGRYATPIKPDGERALRRLEERQLGLPTVKAGMTPGDLGLLAGRQERLIRRIEEDAMKDFVRAQRDYSKAMLDCEQEIPDEDSPSDFRDDCYIEAGDSFSEAVQRIIDDANNRLKEWGERLPNGFFDLPPEIDVKY